MAKRQFLSDVRRKNGIVKVTDAVWLIAQVPMSHFPNYNLYILKTEIISSFIIPFSKPIIFVEKKLWHERYYDKFITFFVPKIAFF